MFRPLCRTPYSNRTHIIGLTLPAPSEKCPRRAMYETCGDFNSQCEFFSIGLRLPYSFMEGAVPPKHCTEHPRGVRYVREHGQTEAEELQNRAAYPFLALLEELTEHFKRYPGNAAYLAHLQRDSARRYHKARVAMGLED